MKKLRHRQVMDAPPLAADQYEWPTFVRAAPDCDQHRPHHHPPQQAASPRQAGTGDVVLAMMRHHNMAMTREKYLDLAYMGEPPAELSAEQEADLPPQFRKDMP
jgi:hypothetical protein